MKELYIPHHHSYHFPLFIIFISIFIAFVTLNDNGVNVRRATSRGPWNTRKIQTNVLSYVFEELCLPGKKKYKLVKAASEEYKVPVSTIYRWLAMWSEYHELPCDTLALFHEIRKNSNWAPVHGNASFDERSRKALEKIVRDRQKMYIDEYVLAMRDEIGLIFFLQLFTGSFRKWAFL